MKELNIIIITTLIGLFILIGVETTKVTFDNSEAKNILDNYPPFDGRIDTEFLSKLEEPAYVQH